MKKVVFLLVVLFISYANYGQILDPELGPRVVKKENTKQRDAAKLTHVREADYVWSTRIWQTIDLRQKMNQPLYFPLDSVSHGKRSFTQIIFDEIILDTLGVNTNVRLFKDYQLRDELDRFEAFTYFQPTEKTQYITDFYACTTADTTISISFGRELKPQTNKVLIMEDWFFDKQRSVMDVRILALGIRLPGALVRTGLDASCNLVVFQSVDIDPDAYREVWFFFPQLREMMAEIEVYKRFNDAARLSFDDIFLKRMFTSYITKEENVFDRSINQYTKGLEALLEAERIKGGIFDFEQNLWEY